MNDVTFEQLRIQMPELRVWLGDREVPVSTAQLRLLMILLSAPQEIFSQEELVQRAGIANQDGLHQVVMKLREKLDQRYIDNERRAGYALKLPAGPSVTMVTGTRRFNHE